MGGRGNGVRYDRMRKGPGCNPGALSKITFA
ncbi:hypothetical protein SAMN04515692_10542 [Leifsonia sp. CL147]|nr:hypothetical protein SAMN04515694_10543 [Leifsonia sp. CL154]SFL46858.1 hypothetical protein SAMN04515692_10542 [Leifsonia sp. CL147]